MNKTVLLKIAVMLTFIALFLFLQYLAVSGAQHYGNKAVTRETVIPAPPLQAL